MTILQVGKLGSRYDKWVHDPVVQKEPPRFFESDIAEVNTCLLPLPSEYSGCQWQKLWIRLSNRGRRLGPLQPIVLLSQFEGYRCTVVMYPGDVCALSQAIIL